MISLFLPASRRHLWFGTPSFCFPICVPEPVISNHGPVESRILPLVSFGKSKPGFRTEPRPTQSLWWGWATRLEPRSGIRCEQHTPPGTCYSRTTGVNIGSSVKTRPSITLNSVNARNQSRPQSCYGRGLPTHLNHVSEQVIWCNGLDLSWPSTGPNGQVRLMRLSWNPT